MCGHLNLRNHIYVTFSGIGYNLPYFFLCVKTAVGGFLSGLLCLAGTPRFVLTVNSHGTHLCQQWVLFDLYAPSLVIYKVPVKDIHFVQSKNIYIPFYEADIEEMPAHIKVHSSPGKPWVIPDSHTWYCPFNIFYDRRIFNGGRKQLPECLH